MPNYRGFTLIELMVTIAVLAIMVAIAVPSFTSLIQNNRTTSLHHEILGAIQLARSEAVNRRKDVIICRTENQNVCANGTNWAAGWLVREVGGDVVKVWDPVAGMALTGPNAGVVFHSSGMADAIANFVTTSSSCTSGAKYAIGVSLTGSSTTNKTGCP